VTLDLEVRGLTTINKEMYVLRGEEEERREGELLIDVWSTDSFNFIRTIIVERSSARFLSSADWLIQTSDNALTSCKENNCLYVCVWSERSVYKVDLMSDDKQVTWRVGGMPTGLSINKKCNVIVTCYYGTIEEYTPSGSLVNRVELQRSEVSHPLHAIELSNGHYAVCHLGPVYGVSVVNREGRVVFTYRDDRQSNTRLSNALYSLAVTANDCILVADRDNNRIIILDSSLRCARDLRLSRDDQLKLPNCIHFDESLNQLFVSEWRGRVLVFEHASILLNN